MRLFAATLATETNAFSSLPRSDRQTRDPCRQRGALSRDRQTEYVKLNRPIWPLDENTGPRLIF
jgi:microcystin degradation protein MlrC